MTSDQLIKFKAICDYQTLIEASNALYISQSAMSQSLKKLEDDLGCKLFTRSQGRLIINQNGQKLLRYTEKILSELKKAESDLKTPYKITIASTNVCAAFILQNFTTDELKQIKLTEIDEKDMPLKLQSGEIDIATCDDFYMKSTNIQNLKKYMLCIEQLALLVPEDHPLYDYDKLTYQDINGLQLCTRIDIPSQFQWIKTIQSRHPETDFNIEFMMERYTFGYIRDKLPYPEILSTNSVIDLAPPIFEKKYRYIKVVEPDAKRNLYMWYLQDNEHKANYLTQAVKQFYEIKEIKGFAKNVYQSADALKKSQKDSSVK